MIVRFCTKYIFQTAVVVFLCGQETEVIDPVFDKQNNYFLL